MTRRTARGTASVRATIAAPPEAVWDLVADVTRMGEWSPETRRCRWLDGVNAPAVGARFAGTNQHGAARWRTECTITEAERGRVFAFTVTARKRLKVSRWRYDLRPVDGGCEVVEAWEDQRGLFLKWYGRRQLGIEDRAAHNRATMEETLARLKAAAEVTI